MKSWRMSISVSTHSRPKAAVPHSYTSNQARIVSTHSRPKAAGRSRQPIGQGLGFNTQPPEGGWDEFLNIKAVSAVSTHSRPKAAAIAELINAPSDSVSTHSRPKAAVDCSDVAAFKNWFQHTAARRRLCGFC